MFLRTTRLARTFSAGPGRSGVGGRDWYEARTDKPARRRRQPTSSSKSTRRRHNKPPPAQLQMASVDSQFLFGVHAVTAALEAGHRQAHCLWLQEGDVDSQSSKRRDALEALARSWGIPVERGSKWALGHAAGRASHQGVVLDAAPVDAVGIRDAEDLAAQLGLQPVQTQTDAHDGGDDARRVPLVLVLDEVQDPHNLGALLRTALFLGVHGVLMASRNCAPLSPVVASASAGALDILASEGRLFGAGSLPSLLGKLGDDGWHILGADGSHDAAALPCHAWQYPRASMMPKPAVLVLGSEGAGLRPLVRDKCEHFVQIPRLAPATVVGISGGGGGGGGGSSSSSSDNNSSPASVPRTSARMRDQVDSLNVSVAAGILCHQLQAALGTYGPTTTESRHP